MEAVSNVLAKYMFPVTTRKVFVEESSRSGVHKSAPEYQAIVREDNGKLISVMKDSYKIVSNYEVIMPLMDELHRLDAKWLIDPSHSFVLDNRMRLQVTFPELTLNDGRSDIALSLFIHNSYDGSEGVRMYWGAIRGICSNGMVFGKVLAKYYRKHTQRIELKHLKEDVASTYDKVPVIKDRIKILKRLEVDEAVIKEVETRLGKGIKNYVTEHKGDSKELNQWKLYNILTYYISHIVKQHMRAQYQLQVSRIFQL
jgi:hypothetical protein